MPSGSYTAYHLYPLNQMSTCTSYKHDWTVVGTVLHSREKKAGLTVTVGLWVALATEHHAFT